jgi:hypothetical protein
VESNSETLSLQRGAGYWLWKPEIIRLELQRLGPKELLLYLDSGINFRTPLNQLLDVVDLEKITVWSGEVGNPLRRWCHRSTTESLGIDEATLSKDLIMAGALVIPNTRLNQEIIEDWLRLCKQPKLLRPDTFPEIVQDDAYIWHRHDSTLLTVLVNDRPERFSQLAFQSFVELFNLHRKGGYYFYLFDFEKLVLQQFLTTLKRVFPKRVRNLLIMIKFRLIAKRRKLSEAEIKAHRKLFK